jgi:RNA recognition motif-containing protein
MPAATLYIGNLPAEVSAEELTELVERFVDVAKTKIMRDRATGLPKGFAYVEVDASDAAHAVEKIDGLEFRGLELKARQVATPEMIDRKPGGG